MAYPDIIPDLDKFNDKLDELIELARPCNLFYLVSLTEENSMNSEKIIKSALKEENFEVTRDDLFRHVITGFDLFDIKDYALHQKDNKLFLEFQNVKINFENVPEDMSNLELKKLINKFPLSIADEFIYADPLQKNSDYTYQGYPINLTLDSSMTETIND